MTRSSCPRPAHLAARERLAVDAAAARFILQLGAVGNIRPRSMKAFPEAAYREIINSLGWCGGARKG